MRLRERDFWTAADASRGSTTSGYERFGRGGGHGNATRWNILLVHPCISPSISLIKRSLLDNFQPRPSLSFIFCSSHFLFPPPPHHPPFPSLQFSFNPPPQLVSSTTLDTFLPFDARTQSNNPGPSRIHPSTSSRLNRGCRRLET